jgi:FAD/FMN-containing dehydrogenase
LQWSPAAVELHARIKQVFDPKNLLNPGKKTAG